MRTFLFGMAFATLIYMRGLIPLHVSAIKAPEGVVAFTGPSGAGKSTKVAELHFGYGWPIICDDVAVLDPSDGRPILHTGLNRIKLWRDAVERFGLDPTRLTRDLTREDKFHLHAPEMFVSEPCELTRLFVVDRTTSGTRDHGGASSFAALHASLYRPEIGAIFADRPKLFTYIADLARNIVVLQGSYTGSGSGNPRYHSESPA